MELLQYGIICQLALGLGVDHLLGPGKQGSCFMDPPMSENSENMQVYSCSFGELQWFQWDDKQAKLSNGFTTACFANYVKVSITSSASRVSVSIYWNIPKHASF